MIENEIIAHYPTSDDAICMPDETAWYAGVTNKGELGSAVEVFTFGAAPGAENTRAFSAFGAPGASGDDLLGEVRLKELSRSTSAFSGVNQTLLQPSPATMGLATSVHQYGAALLGSDIRDCQVVGAYYYNCGEELLVGAPDTGVGGTPGVVLWYRSTGDSANGNFSFGGKINAPAGLPNGADFGSAIAAADVAASAAAPWNPAPAHAPFVAISAPGAEKVYIFKVTATAVNPLTLVQTIVSPFPAGKRFGTSLAVGDFDGDGFFDLAVGAPEPISAPVDPVGHVAIYRGQSGAAPLNIGSSMKIVDHALNTGADIDSFGAALGAGSFFADTTRDALIVGIPNALADDRGGVCEYLLQASGAGFSAVDVDCWENPFTWMARANMKFGSQVTPGNFVNVDDHGVWDSAAALTEEVAISAPGYNGDQGAVWVFYTDDDGVDSSSFVAELQDPFGAVAGEHYGTAVAAGFGQTTGWEDLIIGAPDRNTNKGVGAVTKAFDLLTCDTALGVFNIVDAEGASREVSFAIDDTTGNIHLTFLEPFAMELRDASGNLCSHDGDDIKFKLPANAEITGSSSWGCGSTSATITDAPAGEIATAVLDAVGALATIQSMGLDGAVMAETVDVTIGYADGGASPDALSFNVDLSTLSGSTWAAITLFTDITSDCDIASHTGSQVSEGMCE